MAVFRKVSQETLEIYDIALELILNDWQLLR